MSAMRISSIQLPVTILKEGRQFVAYSPALDLSTSGKSKKQAHARFAEAVSLFFEELSVNNTLEEALRALGWRKISRKWEPPQIVAHDIFRIPIAL